MQRAASLAGILVPVALAAATPPAAAQDPAEYAAQVQAVADGELQARITDPVMIYAIKEANATNDGITERQIQRLDRRWTSEDGSGPMIGDLLDRQASVLLRDPTSPSPRPRRRIPTPTATASPTPRSPRRARSPTI